MNLDAFLYFCGVNLHYLTPKAKKDFIASAIKEDLGDGDHSTLAAISADTQSRAQLLIKDDGIIAGVALAETIFHEYDKQLELEIWIKDGEQVKKGDVGFIVKGSARSILTMERLVLNCLQRMSGIATYTHSLSKMISHTSAKLLDTRKTTPNFRIMEKWAVAIGGGTNHRFGLYDMVMLKDNHIDFAGGIPMAIESVQQYLKATNKSLKIEVETRTLQEVQEVLDVGGIDIIMLDNMDTDTMREAIRMIDGRYVTEASGGITEENIKAIAECGVDFISIGALTHSLKSLDMSLKAL